jgi:hypothetical protein
LARAALAELPGFGDGGDDDDSMSDREAGWPEAPTLL